MDTSTKPVLWVVAVIAAIVSLVVWMIPPVDAGVWWVRFAAPAVSIGALIVIRRLMMRTDLVPDYLFPLIGESFNRHGLCFNFIIKDVDGIAYLDAYFQSQYDRPIVGTISLQNEPGLVLGRPKLPVINFDVACPPAGIGISRVALAVPSKLQGRVEDFVVGATVSHPEGKGRRVRFRDGIMVRRAANLRDTFGWILLPAMFLFGPLMLIRGLARSINIKIELPPDVAEELPETEPETAIIWQLGDPPLDRVAR